MKKKFLAVMSAVMLMVCTSVTAFAASPTVGTTETAVEGQEAQTEVKQSTDASGYASNTSVSEGFTETKVSDTTVASAGVAVQNNLLNNIEKTAVLLGRTDLLGTADNANAKVTATILSAVDITPTSAVKGADGFYDITIKVAGIAAGDIIAIEHYEGFWNTLVPYEVGAGYVKVKSTSCSPFVVVKITFDGQAAAAGNAPQTGETIPVGVIALICVGTAGAFVTGRKLKAARQ